MTTYGGYDEFRARGRSETDLGTWARSTNVISSVRSRSLEQENRRSRRSGSGRKRKRPWTEKLCDGLRSFVAFLFSNVGIVCLVIGYTIAGGFIFVAIEASHEHRWTINVTMIRNATASSLWKLTSEENVFSAEIWKTKVDALLKIYQGKIVDAIKIDGYDGEDNRVKNEKWAFAGAFLYSLTVITTIGYGNNCPKTMWGKLVTIVYAIFGMPLFLLYLSNIGDILARSFKWTYARCCLCRCRKRPRNSSYNLDTRSRDISVTKQEAWQMVRIRSEEDSPRNPSVMVEEEEESEEGTEEDDEDEFDPQHITVPLTVCLAIMVGYICGGAQLFSKWEDWNFLDGSYFCFVSLSTIGFGDIVPGDEIYAGQALALSSVFCSMYLMLGMALIAMCFNLMQEEVVSKIRFLTRSVKHVLNCNR